MKRFFILLSKILIAILIALIGFVIISIGPVDRTPVEQFPAYRTMQENLRSLDSISVKENQNGFKVGFAKINLTPSKRVATAGYGNRKRQLYSSVHDSIFVRAIVVSNGDNRVAIVSADLLVIPPTVTRILEPRLNAVGFSLNNVYLGATHSHNSIGSWGEGATRFIYGAFDEEIVSFIADKIAEAVRDASKNIEEANLKTAAIPVPQAVDNRLVDGGPEDSLLRVIEFHRYDNKKLILTSFTAHATCLFSKNLELSRDYPGALVDTLESRGYDFAMFMAGSVGSHGCTPPSYGWSCIDWMAGEISNAVLAYQDSLLGVNGSSIEMVRVSLPLSDPQVKVLPEWKVRSWLFRLAFGEYPVDLTGLRLGDIVFVGAPADLSGEFNPLLDSFARADSFHLIPTSFNGGYVGYLTPIDRYDNKHYETQLMNWYAPGTGEYVIESFREIITALK